MIQFGDRRVQMTTLPVKTEMFTNLTNLASSVVELTLDSRGQLVRAPFAHGRFLPGFLRRILSRRRAWGPHCGISFTAVSERCSSKLVIHDDLRKRRSGE